jgi:hypothetical protein
VNVKLVIGANLMHSQTWKREERWWAKRYEGVRNPVRGRNDIPDVENDVLAIEVKMSERNVSGGVLAKGIQQARRAAETTGKVPVVGVSLPGVSTGKQGRPARERYVFMSEEVFYKMFEDAEPVMYGRVK